jgi:hypothetical protein
MTSVIIALFPWWPATRPNRRRNRAGSLSDLATPPRAEVRPTSDRRSVEALTDLTAVSITARLQHAPGPWMANLANFRPPPPEIRPVPRADGAFPQLRSTGLDTSFRPHFRIRISPIVRPFTRGAKAFDVDSTASQRIRRRTVDTPRGAVLAGFESLEFVVTNRLTARNYQNSV